MSDEVDVVKEAGHCWGDWSGVSAACRQCVRQDRCELETKNKVVTEKNRHKLCYGVWKEGDKGCKKCTIHKECILESGKEVPKEAVERPLTPFEYLLHVLRNKFDEQRISEGEENALTFHKNGKLIIGIRAGQNGNVALVNCKKDIVCLESLESVEHVDSILNKLL